MSVSIEVVEGDVTALRADALITAINSGGMWFGGVDGAIQRVGGNAFHSQANAAMPLRDGQTVLARGNGRTNFQNVLFVVDDLRQSLDKIVLAALQAAEKAGLRSLTLPAIRTGVMLGTVEPTAEAAVRRIGQAVQTFVASKPQSVTSIKFVVFRDPSTSRMLSQTLRQIGG